MKNLILILAIVTSAVINAQPKFEFYTSYGYFHNIHTKEFLNIDGEHYYWYFNWELGEPIYDSKNEHGDTEFQAQGFFYRKDISRDLNTKTEIRRIRFVMDGEILKAILFAEDDSDINYVILIKGQDGKSFYVEMHFKDKKVNSSHSLKNVVHTSYPFEDDYYISKFPSQN
jgi:hypothetical protein